MPLSPVRIRLPLGQLAEIQDEVVSRHQLRERGYDSDAVRAQLAARRWRAVGNNAVVLHNGPLTTRQRYWVAVLCNPGGALAGVSAAREQGLGWRDNGNIHITLPHGARRHQLPGVRIHVSRHLDDSDIHPGKRLPTMRIDRALTDAAAWTPLPRNACALLAAGVQQRITTAPRLRGELGRHAPARHHALLVHVLGDIEGGAHSFGEIDLGRLARRAGLDPPRRQAFRYDSAGRRRYLDADFDGFSVEVDGAVHLRPLRYWDDMERQNDLVIVTGKPILRFSTVAMRVIPDTVVAQLAAAGTRFGRR